MPLYVYKKPNINELDIFLQGGIIGGQKLQHSGSSYGLWGLVGKTVTFATPVGSVTFVSGADSSGFLSFQEIQAQIAAVGALASLRLSLYDQRIVIKRSPLADIDVGSALAEPGRAILGFDGGVNGHVVGKVYNPPGGGVPALVTVVPSPGQESLVVVTEE